MTVFKKTRELLAGAYLADIISDEEFVLLYDCSFSKNLELPYEEYERFDLEVTDSECRAVLTCHRLVSHDKNQGEIRNKAILCARKFPQIYLLFGFLSEDLTLTFPSICSLKLNYENKIEPNSLGIYFFIIMFTNFGQNMLF